MARQMTLTEHTIQDHLKSIFTKTGARDRVTVLSRALGTTWSRPDYRPVQDRP
jgi:DNA-binding NarL/FixJ family response regulator